MRVNKSFLFLFLTFLSVCSYSQAVIWEKLSGFPQENTINDIEKIPNSNKIIAVCDKAMVMISADGGLSWQMICNPAQTIDSDNLKKVEFVDENTGFILTIGSSILKTTDGGYTWNRVYQDTSNYYTVYLHDLYFLNPNLGFAYNYNGFLLKSVDGGDNWLKVETGVQSNFVTMDFFNDSIGYLFSDDGNPCIKTIDGGETWQSVPNDFGYVLDFHVFNDSTAFMTTNNECFTILKTTDKGESWESIYTNWWMSHISDIHFFDDMNGVVTAPTFYEYCTHIINTDDGGETWTDQTPVLSYTAAYSSCVFGDEKVILGGLFGNIHRSDNMGESWTKMNRNPMYLSYYDMSFIDEKNYVACCYGADGGVPSDIIYKTDDGGETWKYVGVFSLGHKRIHYFGKDSGIVVLEDFDELKIHRIFGEEGNWVVITSNDYFEPYNIEFFDYDNGVTWTDRGVYRTSDGGLNWIRINEISEARQIKYLSGDEIYIAGKNNSGCEFFKSSDAGVTWEEIDISYIGRGIDMHIFNRDTVVICNGTKVVKTCNRGLDWELLSSLEGKLFVNDICFVNDKVGYVVGVGDYVNAFKTVDGGYSWEAVETLINSDLNFLHFTDEDQGTFFGGNGATLRVSKYDLEGVGESEKLYQTKFFSVYPNPAVTETMIKFNGDIPVGSRLNIMDVNGKLIKTFPNLKNVSSIRLSLTEFESGVYLINIRNSNTLLESNKLVVQ